MCGLKSNQAMGSHILHSKMTGIAHAHYASKNVGVVAGSCVGISHYAGSSYLKINYMLSMALVPALNCMFPIA